MENEIKIFQKQTNVERAVTRCNQLPNSAVTRRNQLPNSAVTRCNQLPNPVNSNSNLANSTGC